MSAQQSLKITPPESFMSSPPTPPAIKERNSSSIPKILAVVRRHKDGYYPPAGKHWLRFPLDVYYYRDLRRQLRKANLWDHYEQKLRHDYFPLAKLYVLRMPGLLHEGFVSYITLELFHQLRIIMDGGSPSAIFAKKVESNACAKFFPRDTKYGNHEPDGSFQHIDARDPGVILELSYSQKRKDLKQLADEYILGSDANIRVVIGIDIEYKGSKKACVSIWRPYISRDKGVRKLSVVQTVTDQFFRDDIGNLVLDPQASLQLQLRDFGPEALTEKFTHLTQSIHISAEQLFSFLERAEVKAIRARRGEGLFGPQLWDEKLDRESTPPEQLDSDPEQRFTEQERRTEDKAMMDDDSYMTSSSEEEL